MKELEVEEKEYRVPEYPNKEKGFLFDEEKFGKFSKALFKVPIFGYICGIFLNIVYLYSWIKKKNIISILIILFIDYLIIQIILINIFKIKDTLEECKINKETEETDKQIKAERFRKIISFENPIYSVKALMYIYLIMKFASLVGDRFILLVVLNIFVFYFPIEKKFPHFLFVSRMYTKQVIEGSIGIIECLIPRYQEDKKKLS